MNAILKKRNKSNQRKKNETKKNDDDAEPAQDAFRNYQKKRREARFEARTRAAAAAEARKTPEAMAALRAKFLERVESYIGVPYGKKYHADDPSSPRHDAELYLDCCALVRRSVRDLQEEFGFVLGRGNQAYQFDTLPIRVEGVEQLKPGDLVFYASDIKVGSGLKPQLHDMVHVEVFTGGASGEETVGSLPHTCWRTKGKCGVQRFSSYKCEETAKWKLKRYWFCSIDTWLRGVCQSHCQEHDWREAAMCDKGCAGSVFALDADGAREHQEDESAE